MWVRVLLQSLKLQIWCLFWARSSFRVWIHSETHMWHDKNIHYGDLIGPTSKNSMNLNNCLTLNMHLVQLIKNWIRAWEFNWNFKVPKNAILTKKAGRSKSGTFKMKLLSVKYLFEGFLNLSWEQWNAMIKNHMKYIFRFSKPHKLPLPSFKAFDPPPLLYFLH